jgi:hypothetical protein
MLVDINEELHFCQVIYFASVRSQNWMEQFSKIALKYATELGRVLTHFTFWSHDYKIDYPTLRYIKRNQGRLTQAFGNELYKGIDFYSLDEGQRFILAPYYISLVTKDSFLLKDIGRYGIVLIDCKLDSLKAHTAEVSISREFLNDMKSIVNPRYGAVTVMQWKKIPESYFRNSTSAYLTPEEHQEVKIWEREGCRFETIVRDVYWGNVLTRNHWGNSKAKEQYLLKTIEHECRGNTFWIDENTLFFCAPFDICPQDDPRMLDFKERMYKVFDKCEIEVIRAHMDNYPEPQIDPIINILQDDTSKKPMKLRSKRKLIIRYHMTDNSGPTKVHDCVSEILRQAGRMSLIIRKEKTEDGLLAEITFNGSKVPEVRKVLVYCIKKMNMDIEVNPPIDEEDSIDDVDFTVP